MQELEGGSEIEYPGSWTFKVIGREEAQMREAIAEIVGDHTYTLTFSNQSAQGTYCSLNLDMMVVLQIIMKLWILIFPKKLMNIQLIPFQV